MRTIERLSFLLKNRLSQPGEIVIEVTNRCNLDCKFCFNKLYNHIDLAKELTKEEIKKIIMKISEADVKVIRFSGGEPLLREDIFELMDFAFQKNLSVWLNTNATLINRENVRNIVKYVDNVLIPLNSFDIQHERQITGSNSFKSKLKGIMLLKKNGIRYLRCGTVATKENISHLEKIHNIVKEFKIKYWLLFRPIPNDINLFPIDNHDTEILVEKIITINRESNNSYKIYNAIPFCAYEPEKMLKVAVGAKYDDGHTRLIIDSHGMVKPMYYLNETIGDIWKSRDIKEYWNSKFMKDMRRLKFIPRICKRCKYLNICLGGSRSASKIINRALNKIDYLANPLKYKSQLFD